MLTPLNKSNFVRDSNAEMFLVHLQLFTESLLDFIVGGKHDNSDRGSSDHSGGATSPEGQNTFFFDDSSDGVEETSVVSSLFLGELRIGLDSHKAEIGWVTNQTAQNTRSQSIGYLPKSRDSVL